MPFGTEGNGIKLRIKYFLELILWHARFDEDRCGHATWGDEKGGFSVTCWFPQATT